MSGAVQKVFTVAKYAVYPVTAVGGLIHGNAVRRNKLMDTDWKKVVAEHDAAGTDLASKTTNDFIAAQFKLFPYRIERMKFEAQHLCSSWCKCEYWTLKNTILEIRFAIRLLFMFMVSFMIGRRNVMPLLTPDSPFCEELKYKNPN